MRRAAAIVAVLLPCGAAWLAGPPALGHALLALGFPTASASFFSDPAWKGVALYSAGRWLEAAEAFGTDPASAYNRGNAFARAGRYADAITAYDAALDADPDNDDAAFNKALVAALAGAHDDDAASPVSHPANADAKRELHGEGSPHSEDQAGQSGAGSGGDRETSSIPDGHGGEGAEKFSKPSANSSDPRPQREAGLAAPGEGAGRASGLGADVNRMIAERNRRSARRMERRSVQPTEEWLSTLPDDPGRFLNLKLRAEQARRKERATTEGEQ